MFGAGFSFAAASDLYGGELGITSNVAMMEPVLMSDTKVKDQDDRQERATEWQAVRAVGVQEVNVGAAQVKAIQDGNPNRHNGSAGGDQDHSLEIFAYGDVVKRDSKLTEKDIKQGSAMLQGRVEQKASTEQGVLEQIAALPMDEQAQVIGAGIQAYSQEANHSNLESW